MLAGDQYERDLDSDAQLHQPRLAEVVAGILRSRILEGRLSDGARLPKQEELLREFRVSRPSLREALRILETEGLLTVKRGNVGGAVVRAPKPQSTAYMFGLVLQSRQVTLDDLAEALCNVEPVAAALCARRDDRVDTVVPVLRECLQKTERAIGDGVAFTHLSRQFHEEVVRGCGNETLIVMIGSLEHVWSQQERRWAQQAQDEGSYPEASCRDALSAHRSILRAIESGDPDRASKLARTHLAHTQRYPLSSEGDSPVQVSTPGMTPPLV